MPLPRPRAALLALPCALLLTGCGATTVRASVGPTLDSFGKPGIEAAFGIGIGTPLDFHGRSRHFLQVLPMLGGGADGSSKGARFTMTGDVDYIYWAGPHLDVRGGVRMAYRTTPSSTEAPNLYGWGGHFGIMPVISADEGGWLVRHFSIGPELHLEYLWSDPAGTGRTLISLPVNVDLTFLGAGD